MTSDYDTLKDMLNRADVEYTGNDTNLIVGTAGFHFDVAGKLKVVTPLKPVTTEIPEQG